LLRDSHEVNYEGKCKVRLVVKTLRRSGMLKFAIE